MTATVLSLLLMLVFLNILFSLGCGSLLLLRRTDAPPKGKRMRILWVSILLLSLFPLRLYTPHTSVTVYENTADDTVRIRITETDTAGSAPGAAPETERPAEITESSAPITIRLSAASVRIIRIALPVLLSVWIVGVCVAILGTAAEHRRTVSLLRIHSVPCTDDRILSACRQCARQMGMRLPRIRIFERGMILSPCCSGVFHPTVYVSEAQMSMSDQALSLILLHEFSHIRALDPLLALLTSAACSLHWMNPLGETVRRAVAEDCEMSCDEEVLRICGEEARIPYIHAILDIASGITAHAAGMGSFSVVREHRAEFIKRRYDSMKNKKNGRLTTTLAALMTAILLIGNVLAMSSCAFPSSASDSPAVMLQNPVLQTALEEYFGVEQLTEHHMSLITSLEISVSKINGTAEAGKNSDGSTVYIPVRIRVNGGVVPTESGNFEATQSGADLYGKPAGDYAMFADGFVFESLPILLDKDTCMRMGEAIRTAENGEWNRNKFLAFYCIKDASEETVTALAYDQLVHQFCEGTSPSTEWVLDVNADGSIDVKDISLIGTKRTLAEAEAVVAALPAEVREEYMKNYIEQAKAELLALYPFAEARPMAVLDPETKPREATELMKILGSASLLENRVLNSTEFDLADTALMPNLSTLTLDETLKALHMPE